jgi:hypothetical protein
MDYVYDEDEEVDRTVGLSGQIVDESTDIIF